MRRMAGWVLDAALSAVAGTLCATLLAALLLQAMIGHRVERVEVWFCERAVPWWLSRHRMVGVWWINGQQNLAPTLGDLPRAEPGEPSSEGDPPAAWALRTLPDLAALPTDARFAAIAAGWPLPAFSRSWVVLASHEAFPIPAEIDVSAFAMESGVARLSEDGFAAVRVHPAALAVNAAPWSLLSLWGLRTLRARRLSRPAAAAAPPAPAG